jgi:hypothetical protein
VFVHLVISAILLFALPAEKSEYVSKNGERFTVETVRLPTEDKAYETFSLAAAEARTQNPGLEIKNEIGTAAFTAGDQIAFSKGVYFVRVTATKPKSTNLAAAAQSVSDGLEKGEGEIPVLIKHLPNPDDAQKNAVFLNNINTLTSIAPQQPVLTAVQADGNADAAFATVGASKVLIVEFHTPQLATDNDRRIIARIHELWNLGQPAPTAYRRVGNYSVFVFDAPDEPTAKQLIDQVKYEQVVQWLGDNPNILKEAEQRYINTTLGVLVAVLKASGYAAVACFGIGGLIGALLFTYRRGQQKTTAAYSDAGGMMRLNLDQLTDGSKK